MLLRALLRVGCPQNGASRDLRNSASGNPRLSAPGGRGRWGGVSERRVLGASVRESAPLGAPRHARRHGPGPPPPRSAFSGTGIVPVAERPAFPDPRRPCVRKMGLLCIMLGLCGRARGGEKRAWGCGGDMGAPLLAPALSHSHRNEHHDCANDSCPSNENRNQRRGAHALKHSRSSFWIDMTRLDSEPRVPRGAGL